MLKPIICYKIILFYYSNCIWNAVAGNVCLNLLCMFISFGTQDASYLSIQCPPYYRTVHCVRASPSASTSATVRCVTQPSAPRHHTLRSAISCRLSPPCPYPIPSFIPPLCHTIRSRFVSLPSFRPLLPSFYFFQLFHLPSLRPLLPSIHRPLPSVIPPLSSPRLLYFLDRRLPSFCPCHQLLLFLPTAHTSAHCVAFPPTNRCINCTTFHCVVIISGFLDGFRAALRFDLLFETVFLPSLIINRFVFLRFV